MEANSQFREKEYWNKRFAEEEEFEWLFACDQVGPFLPRPRPDAAALVLGCGNSRLGPYLREQGYANVVNVDFSETVIASMSGRFPNLQWLCEDIRCLRSLVPASKFDLVVDKATLDSLLVTEPSVWRLSGQGETEMRDILAGVSHSLKPGGVFLSLTWSQPHFRLPILGRPEYAWSLAVRGFGEGLGYFCYQMVKGRPLDLQPYSEALALAQRGREFEACPTEARSLPETEDPDFLATLSVDGL